MCTRALMMCTLVVHVLVRVSEWYQKYLLSAGASPVVPERGAAAPLLFYQEGQGGQYCPLHFSTIVTKQTLVHLKARLSKAG